MIASITVPTDHVYCLPQLAKQLRTLEPGRIVEHKCLPGVPLVVVSGPAEGLRGGVYQVQRPGGRTDPVLEGNLII